jgi:hypothetical protein
LSALFLEKGTLRLKYPIFNSSKFCEPCSFHTQIRFPRVLYVAGTIREHCELSVFNCLADTTTKVILEVSQEIDTKLLILNGGQRGIGLPRR